MKYIKQFSIIILISFIGELLHFLIPLPVPASIYGIVLMLSALCTGILKLHQVKDTAMFLIDIMPLMFIPAAVGLLSSWELIKPIWLPCMAITVISTIIVMAVSGKATELVIKFNGKRAKDHE